MATSIFLLRHGLSEDASLQNDAQRTLSAAGAADVARVASNLRAAIHHIYASPLLRTQQTASIMQRAIPDALRPPIQLVDALRPDADYLQVIALLQQHSTPQHHTLVVAHAPNLPLIATHLLGYSNHASGGIVFKPGALARIDFPTVCKPGMGRLVWLITPDMYQTNTSA